MTPRGRWALLGELGLGGEVRPVPGPLPMVAALARRGAGRVVVPAESVAEARLVAGIEVVGVGTLAEVADVLRGRRVAGRTPTSRAELVPAETQPSSGPGPAASGDEAPDLADVRGLVEARRALEIALAGGHGLVLSGPPGSDNTGISELADHRVG